MHQAVRILTLTQEAYIEFTAPGIWEENWWMGYLTLRHKDAFIHYSKDLVEN